MRALVTASAKVGFGAPFELNRRELIPFRHDRRVVADFEVLQLACFKELISDGADTAGLGCGLYFAGAKDTLEMEVDYAAQLRDEADRTAGLGRLAEELNPLVPLMRLQNVALYLAGKEGIDCQRHCEYTSHGYADYVALTAALRDLSVGSVDMGFVVFSRAADGAGAAYRSDGAAGAVGVRVVAASDEEQALEVSSGPEPAALLEIERHYSGLGGADLLIELPIADA